MEIRNILFIFSLSILTTLGCAQKKDAATDNSSSTTPTDGSQSAAQLAGSGLYCATDSTLGGTYAYTYDLTLNADGTYTYAVYITDATSCATAQNSGGNNIATYYQAGVYTVGGTSATPSTGTKVVFTVGSGTMIIRSSTGGASGGSPATKAQNLATWMNGHCTANPGFSTSSDDTKSLNGNVCTSSGSYSAVTLPGVGSTYENVVYNDGSQLNSGSSTGQNLWAPGGSSYPSSYGLYYLSW